jgi:hypothetical protein
MTVSPKVPISHYATSFPVTAAETDLRSICFVASAALLYIT